MPATRRKKPSVRPGAKKGKAGRKTQRRGYKHKGKVARFMNVATAADIPAFEKMMKSGPIVVGMFYLSWCGHCKKAEPSFKEVASKNYPGVNFAMVNSDLKDQTSLRSVQVEGVPDFFVSVPNKGSTNTTIKPEMSYDRPSIERLATIASNAASTDPESIRESLNNKNSLKPPAFLAINAPGTKKSNSLNVQPPSFKNLSMGKKAAVGAAALGAAAAVAAVAEEEEEEEPINAVSEESTDSEDELMVPSYESSINARASINRGSNSLIKPAFSLGGNEPTMATTLSVTSPIEATRSLTSMLPESTLKAASRAENMASLAEQEEAEGRNFSMVGGSPRKPKLPTLRSDNSGATFSSQGADGKTRIFKVINKYYNNGSKINYQYTFIYQDKNGKQKEKTFTSDKTEKIQAEIDKLVLKLGTMGAKEV
jgi:thiol-disulfide isomerase/thioredoxin